MIDSVLPQLQVECIAVRYLMLVEPARIYMSECTLLSREMVRYIVWKHNLSSNLFLGVAGSPSIISLVFDRNSTTLTCTSTGGPPTTVTWSKNGAPVDLSLYEQSQRLVDAVEATYLSVLFNDNVTNFVGAFTCEVSNVRLIVPVQETLELNG